MNDQTDGEEARCLVCQWRSVRPTREFALGDAKDHWLLPEVTGVFLNRACKRLANECSLPKNARPDVVIIQAPLFALASKPNDHRPRRRRVPQDTSRRHKSDPVRWHAPFSQVGGCDSKPQSQ
jgi:hypothetical protein